VYHTDRRYAITVTDTPPTTRSTHGGRACALDIVLTVTSVITLPNKVGDVRGSGDDAGAEHLFILRVHMTWVRLGHVFGGTIKNFVIIKYNDIGRMSNMSRHLS
jgi:hypothetical protein